MRYGQNKLDPALMCDVENKYLREKVPRGNGTLCCLVSVKIRNRDTSPSPKKYYSRKVCTICVKDVKWIEVEHVVKRETMVQLG